MIWSASRNRCIAVVRLFRAGVGHRQLQPGADRKIWEAKKCIGRARACRLQRTAPQRQPLRSAMRLARGPHRRELSWNKRPCGPLRSRRSRPDGVAERGPNDPDRLPCAPVRPRSEGQSRCFRSRSPPRSRSENACRATPASPVRDWSRRVEAMPGPARGSTWTHRTTGHRALRALHTAAFATVDRGS